jgi:RNA polymerase sigma-70 factor (ECF subfamily)
MSVQAGATSDQAFEALMRRFNQKLFRVARSILRNDADAEDAVQDAYLQAYRRLSDFRGEAQLSTWLTRIVINQALMRLRSDKRDRVVLSFNDADANEAQSLVEEMPDDKSESPRDAALRGEIRRLLEHHIDALPLPMRTVLVMRDVEDMSVQETAETLGIPPATVRTRLFRARAMLREMLTRDTDTATLDVFGFDGARCDRIVAAVLARIHADS